MSSASASSTILRNVRLVSLTSGQLPNRSARSLKALITTSLRVVTGIVM